MKNTLRFMIVFVSVTCSSLYAQSITVDSFDVKDVPGGTFTITFTYTPTGTSNNIAIDLEELDAGDGYISTLVRTDITPATSGSNIQETVTLAIPSGATLSSGLTSGHNYKFKIQLFGSGGYQAGSFNNFFQIGNIAIDSFNSRTITQGKLTINYSYTPTANSNNIAVDLEVLDGGNSYVSTVVRTDITPANSGTGLTGTAELTIPSATTLSSALTSGHSHNFKIQLFGTMGYEDGVFTQSVTINSSSNTWSPVASSTDFESASNWSTGFAPEFGSDLTIPSGLGSYPTASEAAEVNSVTMASGTSLIAQSTFSGNITYNRNLGTTNWYLVSSPVAGQSIVDFYTNESPALGSGSGDAQNVAIAPYDNTQALAADRWNYYTEGQVDGTGGDDTTDTFGLGTGYSVKMQAIGDIAFTGTLNVTNTGVDVAIADGSGSSGNAFNLIGNPYPSYINANENADMSNNLLTVNTADLSENTLWFWDQSKNSGTGGYETVNQASAAFHIAPGQGFFVSASGSNTFEFEENLQSHQSSDSFLRTTNNRPEIQLVMTDGSSTSDADIFYIDGTSTGFDNGYDSSMFGGVENTFAIYTHVVANGTGRNLGIQSLPNNNFENMIIPVGVNATSGTQITISALATNFPAGIDVYLEDKADGSFTLLNDSSDFTAILDSDLNGIGRFLLHTSSQALSIDEANLDNISIYTSNRNNLRVVGVKSGNAQVRMSNILGKQILKTSFEGTGTDDITLPNLRTGVYIIQLETRTGKLNKKVIIY